MDSRWRTGHRSWAGEAGSPGILTPRAGLAPLHITAATALDLTNTLASSGGAQVDATLRLLNIPGGTAREIGALGSALAGRSEAKAAYWTACLHELETTGYVGAGSDAVTIAAAEAG